MKGKSPKDNSKETAKPRMTFRRIASNVLFALKQSWLTSKGWFVFYYVLTLIYAPLSFLTGPYLLRQVVNSVENGEAVSRILIYIGVIAGIEIAAGLLSSWYANIYSAGIWLKRDERVNGMLFRKAASVELSCYENPDFYDRFTKAIDEAEKRVYSVMNRVDTLFHCIISLSLNSFLLFFIDPWLILFALIPFALGFLRAWYDGLAHDHIASRKPLERRQKYVRRVFYNKDYSKEMRVGSMYRHMLHVLDDTMKEFRYLLNKYGWKRAFADFINSFGLEVLGILGATAYAIWRTLHDGSMSLGDCIVVLNSVSLVSAYLWDLVTSFTNFREDALYIEDVRAFLDYEPKIKEDPEMPESPADGDIYVENLTFRYDGAENESLKGVNLHIKKGEKIALVGVNGSGKTTLVKLLLRLYDPTSGSIRFGGGEISGYRLSSYRSRFSCLFQDYKLLAFSVKDNVLLKKPDKDDDERVVEALKNSGAYEKFSGAERGIDTPVGREFDSDGVALSVGEEQKLALARAFASDAPVVILDEPSSALDPIAERNMFDNMMRAAEGKTVIIISHRLSSAVDADRILLMESGVIAESGTHSELMELNGKYAEMFRVQAASYVQEV